MNVESQQLPDLTAKNKSEALETIAERGFVFKNKTDGGYETFEHPDGSLIHIRPAGEIVRTGPKIKNDRAVKVTAADTTSLAIRFNSCQVQTPTVPEKI